MAAKGNHTLAVVKASEKYEVLKEAFGNIFSKINNLNTVKRFKVGEKINLELFFGGGLYVSFNCAELTKCNQQPFMHLVQNTQGK